MQYPVGFRLIATAFLLAWSALSGAARLQPEQVPDPLKPWIAWALHGHENYACPFLFSRPEERRCGWPTRLALDLTEVGGRFEGAFRLYADGWVNLPGDSRHWPLGVLVDGRPALVTARDDTPSLWLTPGLHSFSGRFVWNRLPESLALPRDAGPLKVAVRGQPMPFPVFNDQGGLWVQPDAIPPQGAPEAENRLQTEVFRRIIDEVPMQVETRMDLDIAGQQREVLLAGVVLPGFIPLAVQSPLPARMEPDGSLRLQLKPGRWSVTATARHPGPVEALKLPAFTDAWPDQELWSFAARNQLRMVEILGVPAIDPRQTGLPESWKALPAYRLKAGDTLRFRVLRRGDPEPEPDHLSLRRNLWLDFDGQGYTVNDAIAGRMTRNWRIDASPGLRLGRVDIDGQPQSITRLGESKTLGVEVRRGELRLSADSRLEGNVGRPPASGWEQDFQQVHADLHLPPGWRLLATTGVDSAPDTWIGRWTLLDLFIVLIAALAAGRLWGWGAAGITLLSLSLLWHEPGAPRYVWISLLIAVALLRVLPEGRFAVAVRLFRNLSLAALALIAVPFMIDQVRFGLYPQLEMPWISPALEGPALRTAAPAQTGGSAVEEAADMLSAPAEYLEEKAKSYPDARRERPGAAKFSEVDPNALTQTGPGLPEWRWKSVSLDWNGPVLKNQALRLYLLSPGVNLGLNLLRVVLLGLLTVVFLGISPRRPGRGAPLLLIPLLLILPQGARAELPDAKLLEELQRRLLAPPSCLPNCAQITNLRLTLTPAEMRQTLEISALERVLVPLPTQEGQWLPSLGTVDGTPAEALIRAMGGGFWLSLERGTHSVVLSGPLPQRDQLQIPLPLKPRRVEVDLLGWEIEGVGEDGVPESQLRLVRLARGPKEATASLAPLPMAPFLEVARTLKIGLDWRVDTRVRRISPADQPISLEIPLLAGEAVTSPGFTVAAGRVLVNLPPGQSWLSWGSLLEKGPKIELTAPETTAWTEIWRVDVSPVWHLDTSGIPVVHHQDGQGNWLPEWRPWPGERVTLSIVRPPGAPGNILTVDRSRLEISPGLRATDASLALTLRSAQGTQHTLTLPEGAVLQSVAIDGAGQPIRQQGRAVTLPLHPGEQNIALKWRIEQGISGYFQAPEMDLGAPSVNSTIRVALGRDRWVLLTHGPQLGPAVLFWGVLLVIAGIALGLGRIPWTPLKSWHWLLLLIGLSQISVAGALIVIVWLLALGQRAKLETSLDDSRFNVLQIGLAALTAVALLFLVQAVKQGLLGLPDMQIAGNGSSAHHLNWYQDHSAAQLPRPWVVSAPLWVYRVTMLAWALWLAYSLLEWLRWGWTCFSSQGLWRRRKKRELPAKAEQGSATPPASPTES